MARHPESIFKTSGETMINDSHLTGPGLISCWDFFFFIVCHRRAVFSLLGTGWVLGLDSCWMVREGVHGTKLDYKERLGQLRPECVSGRKEGGTEVNRYSRISNDRPTDRPTDRQPTTARITNQPTNHPPSLMSERFVLWGDTYIIQIHTNAVFRAHIHPSVNGVVVS